MSKENDGCVGAAGEEFTRWLLRWETSALGESVELVDELLAFYEREVAPRTLELLELAAAADERAVQVLVDEVLATTPIGRTLDGPIDLRRANEAVRRVVRVGAPAVPLLMKELRRPERQACVLEVLDAMGPALPAHCEQLGRMAELRYLLLELLETPDAAPVEQIAKVLRNLGADWELMESLGRMLRGPDPMLHERALKLVPPGRADALAVDAVTAYVMRGGTQLEVEKLLRQCSAMTLAGLYQRLPRVGYLVVRAIGGHPLESEEERRIAADVLWRSLERREPAAGYAFQRLAILGRLDGVLPALDERATAERWPWTWLPHPRARHEMLLAVVYELIAEAIDDPSRRVAVIAGLRLARKLAPRALRTREAIGRALARPALRKGFVRNQGL